MANQEKMNAGSSADVHENLYQVAHLLSEEAKYELGLEIAATIYLQDPLVADRTPELGLSLISLDWEPGFADGPTSERIAVVDYNADSNVLAEPARWSPEKLCFVGIDGKPISPQDCNTAQFRQVNAFAVVHDVLAFFQHRRVMGRPIPWAFEGNRLIIVPNAGYAENACYDRSNKSLQFYWCGSDDQPVFTCLSHDIVAHETGHAILDGIRPLYNEISSIQTSTFHEYVADLTAILSALRIQNIRDVVADTSKGDLSTDKAIGDLAEMFGQKVSPSIQGAAARPYLRSAHNSFTMDHLKDNWSCHDCSQVLTGAMFDVLTRMTLKQESIPEIAEGCYPHRVALENATTHFTRIALRALDFCPPVDIQFIDYVHALLAADKLAYPRDDFGYRDIIHEIFHERGLCQKSGKEGEACDLEPLIRPYKFEFHKYDINRISSSRTAAYHFLNLNRALLHIPANQDIDVVDLYDTDKEVAARRRLPKEIILEYVWREDILLEGKQFGDLAGEFAQLLCGGTLVFDERGNVLYFVYKPGVENLEDRKEGEVRQRQFLEYIANLLNEGMIGLADEGGKGGFRLWRPVVEGRRVSGSLRFEATPGLRHHGGGMG
ncbi:MAG TPA: hypothetical protein VK253_01060 [Candidatus Binatia bacterium]|nr:hypothetical protein [Candidatus Binatia bacterium]